MTIRKVAAAAISAAALFSAGAAQAALVFVGSWELNDGPASPSAASAQEIAAQLFGGVASDYIISSFGPNVADVNHQAWYGVIGLPGFVAVDSESSKSFGGFDISAYVGDAGIEDRFVNYAFIDRLAGPGIPEPATWGLMIGGFGLTGATLRRRRSVPA